MEYGAGDVEVQCSLRPSGRARNAGETSAAPKPPMAPALAERGRLPRITHTMARAILFEDLLERGEATDHADLARLAAISRERVSQIMKMLWLAPDIQEEILRLPPVQRGHVAITVPEVTAIAEEPLWEEQRGQWSNLKQKKVLAD